MNENSKLRVIIPTFAETEQVEAIVECIQAQTENNFEANVVNCRPGDATSDFLAGLSDERIRELQGTSDLFWTGAVRLGMEAITAAGISDEDVVLVLNCDNIFEPEFFAAMRRNVLELGGFVHALTIRDSQLVSSGVKVMSWAFCVNRHYVRGSRADAPKKALPADMLNGRALGFPARAMREIGLANDKDFPHYCGDLEYTARAKRSGYDLFVVPDAIVTNDSKNTGIHVALRPIWPSFRKLLTDMRSPTNLSTRIRFVRVAYPTWSLPLALPVQFLKTLLGASFYYARQAETFLFDRSDT